MMIRGHMMMRGAKVGQYDVMKTYMNTMRCMNMLLSRT